jgi:hypothetical protein
MGAAKAHSTAARTGGVKGPTAIYDGDSFIMVDSGVAPVTAAAGASDSVAAAASALAANASNALSAGLAAMAKPPKAAAAASTKKCNCVSTAATNPNTNVLIVLSAPWRYFSAAHWFHICEYYLPHHAAAAPKLVTNGTVGA